MIKFSLVFTLMLTSACSQLNIKQKSRVNPFDEKGEITNNSAEEPELDEPNLFYPKKIGLILGPGGVKTFAHTGLIKALEKNNIQISIVSGMGWSALVGGLYAKDKNINQVQWELFKIKGEEFPRVTMFSQKFQASGIDVSKWVGSSALRSNINNFKVDFVCPSQSVVSNVVVWQWSGKFKRALERCISFPPVYKPAGFWVGSPSSLKDAIFYLQERGADLIIVSSVFGKEDLLTKKIKTKNYKSSLIWHKVQKDFNDTISLIEKDRLVTKAPIEVIKINTRSVGLFNFSKRKSMELKGLKAGGKLVKRLKNKYGF